MKIKTEDRRQKRERERERERERDLSLKLIIKNIHENRMPSQDSEEDSDTTL